ncbi:MAG: hypothetical protein HYR84_13700, partial [Planctomycetes bacterium]|nr:hypothetical protein [Planctomycetota bacterium]
MRRSILSLLVAISCAAIALAFGSHLATRADEKKTAPAGPSKGTIDFNRDIRPILSENCFVCHGPDDAQRKAKLRLDTRGGALAKLRGGGHAIVPGKASESAVVQRILADDPGDRMPPAKTNKKLTAAQIDLLKRWI